VSIAHARVRQTLPEESARDASAQTATGMHTGQAVTAGIIGAVVALAVGLFLRFHDHIIIGDAFSRVMNAYFVIIRPEIHLAALGFIWNPLPSFLEIPFVALRGMWPALLTKAVAGVLVGALFGGGLQAYFMYRILDRLGLPLWMRVAWTALYCLNPIILFYNSNGLVDGEGLAAMLGALDAALVYVQGNGLSAIMRSGIWLAVCFLIEYEAVPMAFFIGLGLLIGFMREGRGWKQAESAVVALGFPIFTAGVSWMFLNWMIMKNPFYFADSIYGNASQAKVSVRAKTIMEALILHDRHHILRSALTVGHWSYLFIPVIPAFLCVLYLGLRRKRDTFAWILLGATVAVPTLQWGMFYLGISGGWVRYFIEYVPMGFLLLAYMTSLAFKFFRPSRAHLFGAALSVTVVLGCVSTWFSVDQPYLGNGMWNYVVKIERGNEVNSFQNLPYIADYINSHPRLRVLMDTFIDSGILAYIKNPNQVVVTFDTDFQSVLENPRGRVNAMLVPEPVGVAKLDAINYDYGGMWFGAYPWARLIKQFPGTFSFRLFAIGPGAP